MTTRPDRPHVFVSYKTEDRDRAEQIVIGLRQIGLTVWWDQSLEAGDPYPTEIDGRVRTAFVVLVLWSPAAVGSRWVLAEAEAGSDRLVAAMIEECVVPVPHNIVHAEDLVGWGGDFTDPRWVKLAQTVRRKVDARSATVGEAVVLQPADPLVAYRTRLEASLNVVPRVFRHFGPHSVTDVYVEVRLSGDRLDDPDAAFPDVSAPHRRSVLAPGDRILLEQVLDRRERMWALLGPPGSGKTTLLHRLAIDLLQHPERSRIPVLLKAADLTTGDTLGGLLRKSEWSQDAERLLKEVAGGRAVLLIDGLDEHPEPDSDGLKKVIVGIAADAPGCTVIVTSRPIGYDPPSAQFHRLDLCPLDLGAQRELLSRWVTDPARVDRTLAQLQRSVQLRRLAENPLLLTLVGIVLFDPAVELPTHRSMLYEQAVSTLLRGDHGQGRRPIAHPEIARTALEDLALVLHANEQPEVPLGAVLKALAGSSSAAEVIARWGTGERFLAEVAARTGLLLPFPNAYKVRGYLAPHRSLREHLAACALKRRPAAVPKVVERAKERPATWAEVLALLCGLLPVDEADGLVRQVIATGSQELALRVVADAEQIRPETVYRALRVEAGQENWEPRVKVLREDLPRLVSGTAEPARRAMELIRRFAETTTHGADLWWCQRLLAQLGRGSWEALAVPDDVQRDAAGLAATFWLGHRSPERAALRAELERWWRPIPAGRFPMGSPEDEAERLDREGPQHDVEVIRAFDLLAVPVRLDWYERFDPEHRADRSARYGDGDTHPAYHVTWYEAMAFAAWLGADIRLPCETEWEYACRAGTTTRFWSGDSEQDLARVGWYSGNSGGRTHPVAEKPANPWGLHDLHGNTLEWCADPSTPYTAAARRHDPLRVDLHLEEAGAQRAFRGGGFDGVARRARSAYRGGWDPSDRAPSLGFRLVRLPAPQP